MPEQATGNRSQKPEVWNFPPVFGMLGLMNGSEDHQLYLRAGAIRGSGQPDLEWSVDEGVARKVFALWKGLSLQGGALPVAPADGYGGCFLRYGDDLELFAYGGIVTMMTRSRAESRTDGTRSVERYLVSTAPGGIAAFPPVF